MSTLAIEIEVPFALNADVTDDTLSVDLTDGRTISVPFGWYLRLEYANASERKIWRLIGKGHGIRSVK